MRIDRRDGERLSALGGSGAEPSPRRAAVASMMNPCGKRRQLDGTAARPRGALRQIPTGSIFDSALFRGLFTRVPTS